MTLYPRINSSAALAAALRRDASAFSATAQASGNEGAILGFKGFQAGVEQFAFRDDDKVVPWRKLVTTENLSYQSFSTIPPDRAA